MKAKRERVGTKAKIRAMKERERRLALAATIALLTIILYFSQLTYYSS